MVPIALVPDLCILFTLVLCYRSAGTVPALCQVLQCRLNYAVF